MTTGYSGTPLKQKLGMKEGMKIALVHQPKNYAALLDGLPEGVRPGRKDIDFVHIFSKDERSLRQDIERYKDLIRKNGIIWISWPKKSAKVETDITEQTIRDIALPLGLVDIKVCAVDEIWSGLKLMWRKELRGL